MIQNGTSQYLIVCSKDCHPAILTAAKVLQEFIQKSCGAYLPIVEQADKETCPVISLGNTSFFEKEKLSFNLADLGKDGFYIRTVDKNILIVAAHARGVLFGVYEFLERAFGIKFLSPEETYIPKSKNVLLKKWDIREKPAFDNRCYLAGSTMSNREFSSRMRMNNEWIRMPEEYGGDIGITGGHNTLEFVPPKQYAERHPEWYFKDVSRDKIVDICYSHLGILSNGEVDNTLEESPVKLAIEEMYKRVIDPKNSDIDYFMLAQQDTFSILVKCNCDDCLTQNEFYARSGMLIRFVNAVSRGVKRKLKEAGIERKFNLVTFSYMWSEEAPWDHVNNCPLDTTVVPDDNVFIRLAPANTKNYYSLMDKSQIRSVREMFGLWSKLTNNLMTWTYHVDYGAYLTYFPVIQHWQEDLQLLKRMGVRYAFMQSAHNEKLLWQDKINVYVASKMLWNPSLNPFEIRREFISLYYCGVEKYVNAFIKNFDEKYNEFLGENAPLLLRPSTRIGGNLTDSKLYNRAFWEKQFEVLDTAITAIKQLSLSEDKKEALRKKIVEIRLTPMYMMGIKYDDYFPEDEEGKKRFWESFFESCEYVGYTRYRENGDMQRLRRVIFGA